jgi:hypothetical protein
LLGKANPAGITPITTCGLRLIRIDSDDARVPVIAPRPQVVTEQHHRTGTRPIILDAEAVTENWRRPEQWEQVPRHGRAKVAFRRASAVRDRQAPSCDTRNCREDRVGLLPVPHVEIRQARLTVGALILLANHEDAVGIGTGTA